MAHPKRKISKTRRDKRRTHYKLEAPGLAKCPTTGEMHLLDTEFGIDRSVY
jgi:large subunit ribosomal protein L32